MAWPVILRSSSMRALHAAMHCAAAVFALLVRIACHLLTNTKDDPPIADTKNDDDEMDLLSDDKVPIADTKDNDDEMDFLSDDEVLDLLKDDEMDLLSDGESVGIYSYIGATPKRYSLILVTLIVVICAVFWSYLGTGHGRFVGRH